MPGISPSISDLIFEEERYAHGDEAGLTSDDTGRAGSGLWRRRPPRHGPRRGQGYRVFFGAAPEGYVRSMGRVLLAMEPMLAPVHTESVMSAVLARQLAARRV